jgi:hypothetical protein
MLNSLACNYSADSDMVNLEPLLIRLHQCIEISNQVAAWPCILGTDDDWRGQKVELFIFMCSDATCNDLRDIFDAFACI